MDLDLNLRLSLKVKPRIIKQPANEVKRKIQSKKRQPEVQPDIK